MKAHSSNQVRSLWIYLSGAAAAWLIVGLGLHRNGFMIDGRDSFDWPGLIFMLLSIALTVGVFKLLRDNQKYLRYHFAIYGMAWLAPLVVLSATFQQTPTMSSTVTQNGSASSVENSCPPRLLPRTCTYYKGHADPQTGIPRFEPDEHVFQSGYGAMAVLYAVVGFSLFRYLKRRIKSFRHEELFQ